MREYLRRNINIEEVKNNYDLIYYFQIIGHNVYIELWKSKETKEFFLITNKYSKQNNYFMKFNEEFKIMDLTAQQLYDLKSKVESEKGILNYI